MIIKLLISLSAAVASTVLYAQDQDVFQSFQNALAEPGWIGAAADHPLANEVFRPLPPLETFATDAGKRELGFALFHDPRLSRDGTVACNTCHMGMLGGADGLPVSRGVGGATGVRNAPTVFNAAFNFRQFWDGRAADLNSQALEPITNPVEMAHDLDAVLDFVASDPAYASQFAAL
jgi:cytochrome c peroxidase